MVGRRSTYAKVLGESDAPLALNKHLARYWAAADAPQYNPGGRATRSTTYPSTGAVAAVGFPVLDTLRNLFLRKVEGVGKLSFLAINGAGEVSVLHSLFCVGESAGDFTAGDLFAIQGEISAVGLPGVVRLKPLLFASNFPFVGTSRLEFASHLAGLKSSLP